MAYEEGGGGGGGGGGGHVTPGSKSEGAPKKEKG